MYDQQQTPMRQPPHQPNQMFDQHAMREPSPPTNHRSKDIINTTSAAFEKMKRDLAEREHLLEEKNREILHLRMANEEQA